MKVSLPRLTFRLHDNPLLDDTDLVCVLIQKERLPTRDYRKFRKVMSWGHHQYNLLLQTIKGHGDDLQKYNVPLHVLCVSKEELDDVYTTLSSNFQKAFTDYMTDPVFEPMNKSMSKAFDDLQVESTFTLLDWRKPKHREVLKKYYSKAKPFSKLTPLKDHAKDNVLPQHQTRLNKKSNTQLPKQLKPYVMKLDEELSRIQKEMIDMGMHVHHFGHSGQGSFEQQLLEYAKHGIGLIDSDSWYKPETAIGMNWDCETTMKGKNSSQLSPFFSVGSLSPKFYWETLTTDKTKMGNARDQILFRECFNATAVAAELGLTPRTDDFWSDDNDSKFIDPKARDYSWGRDKDIIMSWQQGKMDPQGRDANESMKELWRNGWLHHLRRHLVADVLARGKLHQHWTEGMYWFRYTLLDHDTAVNRANWMWLSAVAFSSKQKVYHYGWKDYVQRGTPASMKATDRKYVGSKPRPAVKVKIRPVKPVKPVIAKSRDNMFLS